MDIKYIDDDSLDKQIDSAIDNAIANLALEGMFFSEEEKIAFKEEFLNNYKIKVLRGKEK